MLHSDIAKNAVQSQTSFSSTKFEEATHAHRSS